MVHEAKDETAQSNKLLNEANGKIDVLEAEVQALKALVLTSTPSEPNKHLHPHLSNSTKYSTNFLQVNQNSMTNSTSSNNIQQTPNKNLKSAHKRTPSYNDVAKNYQLNFKNPEDNVLTNAKVDENTILKYEIYEIDPIYFKEIVLWREVPYIDLNNSFISRVYNEDIIPCINFNNKEVRTLMKNKSSS
jgi:Rab-3A-interacting protein